MQYSGGKLMKSAAAFAARRSASPPKVVSGEKAKRFQGSAVLMWLGAILSLASFARAQSPNASVTGQVVDSSKAIIVGAHVLATNVSTDIRREAATNGA